MGFICSYLLIFMGKKLFGRVIVLYQHLLVFFPTPCRINALNSEATCTFPLLFQSLADPYLTLNILKNKFEANIVEA